MKSKFFSLVILAVLFAFLAGAQAQDKTKDTGKDKTKTTETKDKKTTETKDQNTTTETKKVVKKHGVSVKINPHSVQKCVEPGKTFTVNVDISNNNKKGGAEWNSDMLKVEVEGPFTYSGSAQSKLVLLPGEYGTFIVNIKAPVNEGKEHLKMTVTDNGKKMKTLTKKMHIGVCTMDKKHDKKETNKETKKDTKDVKKEEKKETKKN
jgi:hypothetical protein